MSDHSGPDEITAHLGRALPLVDVRPLLGGSEGKNEVAQQIGLACREIGFFYVVGHGVDQALQHRLETLSRAFFAQPPEKKLEIRMSKGGRAWRGYFPVGGELTSGKPDLKEGLYFGRELSPGHPMVSAGVPLHGPNLFPSGMPGFRETILEYMAEMSRLGHELMKGIALSLGLEEIYFARIYRPEPLILFRIFNYPATPEPREPATTWGVGEHTDYGLLTILKQDDIGGLEIKSRTGWIPAPPIPGSFVCNIGDMLDRMTGGLYRSTPHRARNLTSHNRLSFPFFFDPDFNAEVERIPLNHSAGIFDDREQRWDSESVHEFQGTYGEYLLKKVGRVFPELGEQFLDE